MSYNEYRYTLCGTDATTISELDAQGFPHNSRNADDTLRITDKKDDTSPSLTSYPDLPEEVTEDIDPRNMSHQEARIVMTYSTWIKAKP